MTTDVTLQSSLRNCILDLGLTPQTTLAAQANPGDLAVNVTDLQCGKADGHSHFQIGGSVLFDDAQGEELLTVKSVSALTANPNTVTIQFAGVGYSGLKYQHNAGTIVYTNLMTESPAALAPMLALGDPLIYVLAAQQDDSWVAMSKRYGGAYQLRVYEHRRITMSQTAPMDPTVFAHRQQEGARNDLNAIFAMVATNPHLVRLNQPDRVIFPGRKGAPSAPFASRNFQRLLLTQDVEQFRAYIDIYLEGQFGP